jgi:TolA-binding protein
MNALRRLPLAAAIATVLILPASPALAVSKEIVQLQTQVQQLQDAVARLQQSNDERMGVMKDLVQQSADSVNRMSSNVESLQKQIQSRQEAQNGKVDQVSGQIQSLNDSLDEIKARLGRLEKLMQDVQSQQQSLNMNMPAGGASAPADNAAPANTPPPTVAPAPGRKGKPSAGTPMTEAASSEFSDVVKFYPDHPLAGNSYYYQAEIAYRGGKYQDAIKDYDRVLEQYPDNNKVPVSHLHKGQALISLKQNDAGVRELRSLIQRFPNSPEAMQARSKLSGMGIPVTPRH